MASATHEREAQWPSRQVKDRHANKARYQVRDIPPEAWEYVRAASMARGMNVGVYLTRLIELHQRLQTMAEGAERITHREVRALLTELELDSRRV